MFTDRDAMKINAGARFMQEQGLEKIPKWKGHKGDFSSQMYSSPHCLRIEVSPDPTKKPAPAAE